MTCSMVAFEKIQISMFIPSKIINGFLEQILIYATIIRMKAIVVTMKV